MEFAKSDGLQYIELLNNAAKLIDDGDDKSAKVIYKSLLSNQEIEPFIYFKLGEIDNRAGNIMKSIRFHKKAFMLDKHLAKRITPPGHANHNYVYNEVDEQELNECPLCGNVGELHSCYNMITDIDHIYSFNPIRVWKICRDCNHLFAGSYPKRLEEAIAQAVCQTHMKPNTTLLPVLADILSNIKKYTNGNKLLEVGVGAGEMTAVAKEMLYDVTGVEIRPIYAKNISKSLNIPVHIESFQNFITDKFYDVIILGDVIEHVPYPIEMLKKAYDLLNKDGSIWISTPNFESAFSYIMKDKDPIWKVCEHINYFSYKSLTKVLEQVGFRIVDYRISRHYNGSMEIIALKQS